HTAYPAPRNPEPAGLSREEVLAMLKVESSSSFRDFILVDLCRTDHEVRPGFSFGSAITLILTPITRAAPIRGSVNLPAQSLYPTLPTLYSVLKAAGMRKFIWCCSSSRGRGNRAAGWFVDHLSDRGDSDMQSLVLVDGIKGWATAGPEYTQWMDEYDESVWLKS
ncbi:hypothetical protein B0T18DRAFT_329537, partial [Schizothecium vesticola]